MKYTRFTMFARKFRDIADTYTLQTSRNCLIWGPFHSFDRANEICLQQHDFQRFLKDIFLAKVTRFFRSEMSLRLICTVSSIYFTNSVYIRAVQCFSVTQISPRFSTPSFRLGPVWKKGLKSSNSLTTWLTNLWHFSFNQIVWNELFVN